MRYWIVKIWQFTLNRSDPTANDFLLSTIFSLRETFHSAASDPLHTYIHSKMMFIICEHVCTLIRDIMQVKRYGASIPSSSYLRTWKKGKGHVKRSDLMLCCHGFLTAFKFRRELWPDNLSLIYFYLYILTQLASLETCGWFHTPHPPTLQFCFSTLKLQTFLQDLHNWNSAVITDSKHHS